MGVGEKDQPDHRNVAVTGILSFALTAYLGNRERERQYRDSRARSLSVAWQELKAGFEQMQLSRFMLAANPTAGTLIEQLPQLFSSRARLQHVQREQFIVMANGL